MHPIYGQIPPGTILTLTDGIAVKHPGVITDPLIRKWVEDIVEVDVDSVADAMMLLTERAKLYVEGGGAVGVSALLTAKVTPATTGTTCVVLSGSNVDLGLIPNLVRQHEIKAGRRLNLFVHIGDRPGGLARLLTIFADLGANHIEVQHLREGLDLHVRETGVQIVLEVRGCEHSNALIESAMESDYEISRVGV